MNRTSSISKVGFGKCGCGAATGLHARFMERDRQAGGARLHEEDAEDAAPRDRTRTACGGGDMSRKMIPVEESIAEWRKDPD
jgi:hypothetical protein